MMPGNSGVRDRREYSIPVQFGDAPSHTAPAVHQYKAVALHWGGRILGWDLLADRVGSIAFDVRRVTKLEWRAAPGITAGVSIVGGAGPSLAADSIGTSFVDPGVWDTALKTGDWLVVVVTSIATLQQIDLTFWCREP